MIPLINLKMLKLDMLKQNWIISSFFFTFKNTNYIVLVKLYSANERKPKLALLKLHFMRENHFDDDLEIPANVYRLMVDPKTLRTYFKIAYSENLGDILKQFTIRLGNSIPTGVKQVVTINEKRAMVHSLSNSDAENPNKIYCYKVRRNPNRLDGKPGQRSIFHVNNLIDF